MWHMATPEFLAAAGELLLAGRRTDLGILCSESLWWRCHRSMVADFVVYAGGEVVHLQPARTLHSAAIGDRLARYAPEVLVGLGRLARRRDPASVRLGRTGQTFAPPTRMLAARFGVGRGDHHVGHPQEEP